ncbi:MAG: nucleotidyltransferase domain-containing protein, partial [Bacteroidales bacterium]|nr:nucleotidyltransferase domain-containing protein [Bacteroidales bacterium]
IRKLREEKKLPLRTVAAYLDIDQEILSKIERGQRRAARELVVKLAGYFKVKKNDLLTAWLSDKLAYELENEDTALKALHVAEQKIVYGKKKTLDNNRLFTLLKNFFKKDGRIAEAWIFGSFSRGEQNANSDIDLMIRFNDNKTISLFDFADIAYLLEKQTNRRIDLVEKGCILPFAWNTAKNNLIKIYG